MIVGINFADKKWRRAQILNTWSMKHKGKIDKIIEYSPGDIDEQFQKDNAELLSVKRGYGYWLWKPYFINKTLKSLNAGDYLFYCDSGAVVLNNIQLLVDALEETNQDVMCFSLTLKERLYSKRDAFIILDCDSSEYYETNQRLGGYILMRKTSETEILCSEWLQYATDSRIISDDPNALGEDNYYGFIENRHDQTIWSLLTKKHNINPFRDPSQFGTDKSAYDDSINARSNYPMMIDSHRSKKPKYWFEYKLMRMKNPIE